jgi:hypothetical protein
MRQLGRPGSDCLPDCTLRRERLDQSQVFPITRQEELARRRSSVCEHVIGKLKVFRILMERHRNRRRRFGLRINLIAAVYGISLANIISRLS